MCTWKSNFGTRFFCREVKPSAKIRSYLWLIRNWFLRLSWNTINRSYQIALVLNLKIWTHTFTTLSVSHLIVRGVMTNLIWQICCSRLRVQQRTSSSIAWSLNLMRDLMPLPRKWTQVPTTMVMVVTVQTLTSVQEKLFVRDKWSLQSKTLGIV